jgi:anthranilate phosphoribosyltransferase
VPVSDPVSRAVHALADRRDLDAQLTEDAFRQVMEGQASPVLMAALLVGLRIKGETAAEVVGAVRALRGAMVRLETATDRLVDTCGTGGGTLGTFNISTAAALVAAGAGARIAKHGNRSFTSQSGSADVLEALGVTLPPTAPRAAALLDAAGMTFLFAPLFHPAMKHVGPVRRELAMHTLMNILGPLANPAGVRFQVVGVADPARGPLIAGALAALGCERGFVVHAREGMDEISPLGVTDVWEVGGGEVRSWVLDPAPWKLPSGDVRELAGGTPQDNARTTTAILAGEDRSVRAAAVAVNAAAALVASGTVQHWKDGVEAARAALASGAARQVLERLIGASRADA